MVTARSSYAGGHFELRVDGHEPTAYVRSVEGGWSRAKIADSGRPDQFKQITTIDIDPITVELGLAGARDMLRWVQQSWGGSEQQRRNGQITYADFDLRTMFEHEFFQALITETTFPTLDGASKEGGYLKCKLQPESVVTKARGTAGPRISGVASPLQKLWTPAAFRLNIDGVEDMQYVNKLDSFTVTLETKKMATGASRFPEIVPLAVKFPNLTGTISMRYAEQLINWHQAYIRSQDGAGTKDGKAHRSGSIEFLTPDRKQTLFRINLEEVGPMHITVAPAKANEEQIRRLQFELYVRRMRLEGSSLLGFV